MSPQFTFNINSAETEMISTANTVVNLSWTDNDINSCCITEESTSTNCDWKKVSGTSAAINYTLSQGDGTKTINAFLKDNAGNISKMTKSVVLDTTPPTINSLTKTSDEQTSITVSVSVSDNQNVSTYYYKIGTNSYVSTTSNTYTFTGLTSDTSYSVSVYVEDMAKNQSAVRTEVFKTKKLTESDKTLAALNLTNQVQAEPTTYNMFDYTWAGYQNSVKVKGISETEGLYAMEDDFGMSYYFRGSKALNNIVKFGKYDTDMYYYQYTKSDGNEVYSTGSLAECQAESSNASSYCKDSYKYANAGDDMYWRIVRINGDGTLRLMYIGTSATATGINSYAGRSPFKYNYSEPKHSGYTYDNSAPNVQDGTASDIKNYLDTWYTRSMSSEDTNIAMAQFYSDTTGYEYNRTQYRYIYSSMKRLNKSGMLTSTVSPTLKTNMTTETYGGIYNLKVGLLNIDEMVMSGYDGIYGSYGYDESGELYPYTVNTNLLTWTFSPAYFNGDAGVFGVDGNGIVCIDDVDNYNGVRPVINLTAEYARQLTGSGSKTSPYTVS